jgi:hypothetical protein
VIENKIEALSSTFDSHSKVELLNSESLLEGVTPNERKDETKKETKVLTKEEEDALLLAEYEQELLGQAKQQTLLTQR